MKKFIAVLVLACASVFNLSAAESLEAGIWFDVPVQIARKSIEGVGLGVPVIANASTEGASLALCGNNVQKMTGLQFAFLGFNYAKSLEGVQIAFVNLCRAQHGDFAFQWGFFNQSGENGIQVGFLNHGQNNASFQLGLININKNGLLPVMIFVNLGKDLL